MVHGRARQQDPEFTGREPLFTQPRRVTQQHTMGPAQAQHSTEDWVLFRDPVGAAPEQQWLIWREVGSTSAPCSAQHHSLALRPVQPGKMH